MSEPDFHHDEVLNGVPVPARRPVPDASRPVARAPIPRAAVVPARQAAALAATGFVAGAAAVAVVGRRPRLSLGRRGRRRKGLVGEIVSSNSFLVDVHLIRRP